VFVAEIGEITRFARPALEVSDRLCTRSTIS
jgi:hypothetical protein